MIFPCRPLAWKGCRRTVGNFRHAPPRRSSHPVAESPIAAFRTRSGSAGIPGPLPLAFVNRAVPTGAIDVVLGHGRVRNQATFHLSSSSTRTRRRCTRSITSTTLYVREKKLLYAHDLVIRDNTWPVTSRINSPPSPLAPYLRGGVPSSNLVLFG